MTPNHIKILYALNALVLCAVLGFFGYFFWLKQSTGASAIGSVLVQPTASTTDQAAHVTVGNNKDNPAAKKLGVITQLNGNTLSLKDGASGIVYTVSYSNGTAVELLGDAKPPADYQKELDAYYAKVQQLVQDPIKNKAALESLEMPTTNYSKPGNVSNLAVGDIIAAFAEAPISGKTFTAIKIVKAPSQTR